MYLGLELTLIFMHSLILIPITCSQNYDNIIACAADIENMTPGKYTELHIKNCNQIIDVGKCLSINLTEIENIDLSRNKYEVFKEFKQNNSNFKGLVSICKMIDKNEIFNFLNMIDNVNETHHKQYIDKLLNIMEIIGIDGINIPSEIFADNLSNERIKIIEFFIGLKERFFDRNQAKFLLTTSFTHCDRIVNAFFDFVNKYFDFIYVMCRENDFFTSSLENSLQSTTEVTSLNIIVRMINWDFNLKKVIFGIDFCARAYHIDDTSIIKQIISYHDVCSHLMVNKENWQWFRDLKRNLDVRMKETVNFKEAMIYTSPLTSYQKAKYAFKIGMAGVIVYELSCDNQYPNCEENSDVINNMGKDHRLFRSVIEANDYTKTQLFDNLNLKLKLFNQAPMYSFASYLRKSKYKPCRSYAKHSVPMTNALVLALSIFSRFHILLS